MGDLLVLCYHAVSPSWPAPLATTPERLAEQLADLRRRGYRGVTFSEAVAAPARGRRVAVTFDDAYRSVATRARPILDELGWPATVFVPTAFPGFDGPLIWPGIDEWLGTEHEQELHVLDWDALRDLVAAGWEVGSHTCNHPYLTLCTDAELDRELGASRAACEEEVGACTSVAYPYGDVDDRVVAAARRAGYTTGAGLPARLHGPRTLEWPRVGVYRVDDLRRFRLKSSRTVRRVRRLLPTPRLAGPIGRRRAARRAAPGR